MKTRNVLLDFGQEVFGESPCHQDGGGKGLLSEATDGQQIAESDQRTGAMPPKVQDAESAAPPANQDLNP